MPGTYSFSIFFQRRKKEKEQQTGYKPMVYVVLWAIGYLRDGRWSTGVDRDRSSRSCFGGFMFLCWFCVGL